MFNKSFVFLIHISLLFTSTSIKADEAKILLEGSTDWANTLHQNISNNVYLSAAWFDSFFIEEGDEQISPKTSARIIIGWEPKARDFNELGARFKLKVRLPHLKDKVDLIFSDTSEDQFEELPLESINKNSTLDEQNFAAAIRYIFNDNDNAISDARIGLSGGDIFIRARQKRSYNWNEKHNIKIEPALFYYLGDGLGARLLLEYNYQINSTQQYRINYSIRGSEEFSGIRWNHGFYHLKQWSDKTATLLGIEVDGERNGERGFIVDNYSVNYRYRFNALKKWLYFEVEPFIEFPEEENYKITPGIALRIEGLFHKANK